MAVELLPSFTRPVRQRWESILAEIRRHLLANVWCVLLKASGGGKH